MLRKVVSGVAAILASASAMTCRAQEPAAGELAFKQCDICHQLGERAKNQVGPNLNGIIGRRAGSVQGYEYSPGFKGSSMIWDDETFRRYMHSPRSMFPGTKMALAGLTDDRKIEDLLAYLKQFAADGKLKR